MPALPPTPAITPESAARAARLRMAQQSHELAAGLFPDLCEPEDDVPDGEDPARRVARLFHDAAVRDGAECDGHAAGGDDDEA